MGKSEKGLRCGWATVDITPNEPVNLRGQFHVRISEGVRDPITATAWALESDHGTAPTRMVLVSCDLCGIPDELRDKVRSLSVERSAELEGVTIVLNATHTHTGPEMRGDMREKMDTGGMPGVGGIDLPVQDSGKTLEDAAAKIAAAVVAAWRKRGPAMLAFGLGHAVVGYNRRVCYLDGSARMYGPVDDPQFSHIEGHEDHSVGVIGCWDPDGALRGVLVNVACPSQCSESEFMLSADYWHETRVRLRKRLGKDLFVLPQCAAAGDQAPRPMLCKAAEKRMRDLAGRNEREEIALRISNAVCDTLSVIEKQRDAAPVVVAGSGVVALTRRLLTPADLEEARRDAVTWRETYERLRDDIEAHPERRGETRWYIEITKAFRRMMWNEAVRVRFENERRQPRIPVEVHVLRIGDLALATNPFELYLDFGRRIQGSSPAVQTMTVQLAGAGTYLPTQRAISGRSYGAVPASSPVGPEGGQELVEHTLARLRELWRN